MFLMKMVVHKHGGRGYSNETQFIGITIVEVELVFDNNHP